jgi:hypothetical protein
MLVTVLDLECIGGSQNSTVVMILHRVLFTVFRLVEELLLSPFLFVLVHFRGVFVTDLNGLACFRISDGGFAGFGADLEFLCGLGVSVVRFDGAWW